MDEDLTRETVVEDERGEPFSPIITKLASCTLSIQQPLLLLPKNETVTAGTAAAALSTVNLAASFLPRTPCFNPTCFTLPTKSRST